MTRDQKIYRTAFWLACFIMAGVLLSGYQKLFHPADFALAVYRFHLLPGFLVNIAALYVSWLEMICAICLLAIPKFRVAALWIVLGLLMLFTGGIVINLVRGTMFGCGCFGSSSLGQAMDWTGVLRNVGLMLLAVLALRGRARSLPRDR